MLNHGKELEKIRRIEKRYEINTIFTEAIKSGNYAIATQYFQELATNLDDLIRTTDHLRNMKNLCLTLNTQLRHAMESSDIHPYRLDQVSEGIALQIEKFKSPQSVQDYALEVIRLYCELAQETEHKKLSPLIRQAITYIRLHLIDNLTVKDAAKVLLVNADYLSNQFHKEVGITFISYVNRERVRQAAALLSQTDLSIQQIATIVGYNNSSYFAKQFVHFYGITPRTYRKSK